MVPLVAALVMVAVLHDLLATDAPTHGETVGVLAVLTARSRVRMAGGRRHAPAVVIGCPTTQRSLPCDPVQLRARRRHGCAVLRLQVLPTEEVL